MHYIQSAIELRSHDRNVGTTFYSNALYLHSHWIRFDFKCNTFLKCIVHSAFELRSRDRNVGKGRGGGATPGFTSQLHHRHRHHRHHHRHHYHRLQYAFYGESTKGQKDKKNVRAPTQKNMAALILHGKECFFIFFFRVLHLTRFHILYFRFCLLHSLLLDLFYCNECKETLIKFNDGAKNSRYF